MSGKPNTADSERTDAEALGIRLRDRRKALKLTLQDVADGAGLSVGFISQVERDLTIPSLSSLASIAGVLEMPVSDFLSQPEGRTPHTRSAKREVYSLHAKSLQYERLSSSFPGSLLNSVIVHEPPGHRSEPISHEGEEMFYVLAGEITVEVEGEATVLAKGDSIHFDSTRRHSSWNHTAGTVTILHVCTLNVFDDTPSGDDRLGNRARHETADEKP